MDIFFVWDETLGEQVRAASDRAMQGQVSDMESTADRFDVEATS